MVYRHTPLASAIRSYTAGGSRAMIDTIDDSKLMQESTNPQGMRGESWPSPESPQNYGFSSVVADADKGSNGMIKQCAEGFMSFMGGNRSFPVMGMMDDRRHRLKNLAKDAAKGAAAMFGLKEWGQQFLNTEDGQFLTGNIEKKHRFALVENQNGKKQQQQQPSSGSGGAQQASSRGERGLLAPVIFKSKSGVEFEIEVVPFDAGGGGNGSGGGDGGGGDGGSQGGDQQGSQPTGQKTLHKEDSTVWIEQNKKDTQCTHGDANSRQRAGSDSTVFYGSANSCQSTDGHSHIMGQNVHIWVAGGCFSDMPITVVRDGLCKNR